MLLRINHFASRIRLRIKQSKILLNYVFSLFIEYHAPLSVTWQISLLNLLLASNGNLTHSLLKLPPSWGSLLYATFRCPQLMTIWKVISGGWGCVCLCGCGCMCGGVCSEYRYQKPWRKKKSSPQKQIQKLHAGTMVPFRRTNTVLIYLSFQVQLLHFLVTISYSNKCTWLRLLFRTTIPFHLFFFFLPSTAHKIHARRRAKKPETMGETHTHTHIIKYKNKQCN